MKKLMSKILFALIATALVATGAQAATVVKQDGFTYDLSGDLQIQLRQDHGDDQDLDVEYDDLEIKNAVSYELANGLTAFGELDFSFNAAAENEGASGALEEAYVGLAYQNYSVLVGDTDNAADGFGISAALETYYTDDAFDLVGKTSSDDMIMVKADFDVVNVVASYELEGESESSTNPTNYEILVAGDVAGVELAAAYQHIDEDAAYEVAGLPFTLPEAVSVYGVSIAYDAEVVWVGADYSVADFDGDKVNQWNLAVQVPVNEATTVAAGYTMVDLDDFDQDDVSAYYANVQYMLHKNVKIFAEIGDTDQDDVDMGYLAGMQVKF